MIDIESTYNTVSNNANAILYCNAILFRGFLDHRARRRGDRVRSSSSGGTDMEPYTHVESVEMWEEILEDAGNALVVVDFWATWWCVRCLRHRACGVRALRATLL